jgi:hypothetical protein
LFVHRLKSSHAQAVERSDEHPTKATLQSFGSGASLRSALGLRAGRRCSTATRISSDTPVRGAYDAFA